MVNSSFCNISITHFLCLSKVSPVGPSSILLPPAGTSGEMLPCSEVSPGISAKHTEWLYRGMSFVCMWWILTTGRGWSDALGYSLLQSMTCHMVYEVTHDPWHVTWCLPCSVALDLPRGARGAMWRQGHYVPHALRSQWVFLPNVLR